jgi:hypothetical protein
MVIDYCNGRQARFEVCALEQGYGVRRRDRATGQTSDESPRLFHSPIVALAFAELAAAEERLRFARADEADDLKIEVAVLRDLYREACRDSADPSCVCDGRLGLR